MNGAGREEVGPDACQEGPSLCTHILTIAALFMVVATLPLSLIFVIKVVQVGLGASSLYCYDTLMLQEYERAVIFRRGRLLQGGASGPGVFFIIPCLDFYVKIDMRSQTYEIPPQEVGTPDPIFL